MRVVHLSYYQLVFTSMNLVKYGYSDDQAVQKTCTSGTGYRGRGREEQGNYKYDTTIC